MSQVPEGFQSNGMERSRRTRGDFRWSGPRECNSTYRDCDWHELESEPASPIARLRKRTSRLTMAPMSDADAIGQRIRRERLDRGMTQRDLAKTVGVGAPHISKIEAGRESPSDELLKKIAEVLGCDFEELLLAARRLPPDLMDELASDPKRSLEFLRQWRVSQD